MIVTDEEAMATTLEALGAAHLRISELEALLGKVREWSELDRPDLDELHIILDGKEGT